MPEREAYGRVVDGGSFKRVRGERKRLPGLTVAGGSLVRNGDRHVDIVRKFVAKLSFPERISVLVLCCRRNLL